MGQPIQEPSMEDILASIKRIIAEDGEAAPAPARGRRGPVAVPDPEPVETGAAPDPDPAEQRDEPERTEPEPARAAEPAAEPADVLELTSPIEAPFGWQPTMLSNTAEQASRSAFAALSQAQPPRAEEPRGQTMEGFVADMLRPMLSAWLDRELPAIVERIVTAEVRRISGRG